jgi:membrane associated rhomboid family serine protease
METKDKILWGSDKNALIALISINLVMFVFFRMLFIIFQNDPETHLQDYNSLIQQFQLPSSLNVFVNKIWTLFIYFFSNDKFIMLISNLLWLFSFAYLLQQIVSNDYLIPSYIYGGVTAGVVYLIANAILPNSRIPIMGATPAILSVAATLMGFAPKHKILTHLNGGIPLWVLFIVFILMDIVNVVPNNPTLLIAHLAAVIMGYLYAKSIQKGSDFGRWMHDLYDMFLGKEKSKKKLAETKQFYQQKVVPFSKEKIANQHNIDAILDKINNSGIETLTTEEKLILQKAKNKL